MNYISPSSSVEIDQVEQTTIEGDIRELVSGDSSGFRKVDEDVQLAANSLETLMRRVSVTSTREIDRLIGELKTLREKLASDENRLQREMTEYADLNQSVIRLTKIVSEGLTHIKAIPTLPKAKDWAPRHSSNGTSQKN